MLVTPLLLIMLQSPTAETAPVATGAPADTAVQAQASVPLLTASRVMLEQPVLVHFEVPTSAGALKGTVRMTRLDIRGLTTRGGLDVRGRLDPSTISTGDPVADAHLARRVLESGRGSIVFGSNKRLTSDSEGAAKTGFGIFLDGQRGGRYREVFYELVPETAERMRIRIEHSATAAELGLTAHSHPFVEVTGPVVLSIDAPLVATR